MNRLEILNEFRHIIRQKNLTSKTGYQKAAVLGNNLLFLRKKLDANVNDSGVENLGTDWMLRQMGEGNFKFARRWAWLYRHYIWAKRVPSIEGRRARVVDIGCDVGEIRKLISKSFYTMNPLYIGIDMDHRRLSSGAEQIQMKVPAIYIQRDVTTGLGFIKDHSVDLVYAGEIIEHFKKKFGRLMLKEIFRILKPNGRVLLSTPNKANTKGFEFHVYEYMIQELRELILETGFSIDKLYGWTTTEKRVKQSGNKKLLALYELLKDKVDKDLVVSLAAFLSPSVSEAFCIEAIKPEKS